MRDLVPRIKALFRCRSSNLRAVAVSAGDALRHKPEIIVIGVSTGGPALQTLCRFYPAISRFRCHRPAHAAAFTRLLATVEPRMCSPVRVLRLPCSQGQERYLSRAAIGTSNLQSFLLVGPLRLTQAHPSTLAGRRWICFFVPLLDLSKAAIGVVPTGIGSDGLEGCKSIRKLGGRILVQDRATSAVCMPGVVAEAGITSHSATSSDCH